MLQAEHIKPRWAGGEDNPENLTVLCAEHNRQKYREQAGIRMQS
jgi:5-methylcytosine-specific restriction endonuclease McrA